jgi:hypothetical protein
MTGRGASGTEYRSRLVAHLLALKDAPNTTLLDQVRAIGVGVTAARHMLFDKAVRLCSIPTSRRRWSAPPWSTASMR